MQSQSEDALQLRLVLHYVSNVAHVWYVAQHFYFSVSQLQFAALISFSSSYMHRASCHSQHVASSLINDVNDAFAAIACPDYFHRRATRSQTQLSTLNWNLIGHATSKPCKSHF